MVAISDSAGNTIEKYAYDVYGAAEIRNANGSIRNTSLVGNPYLFTGRRFDNETDLYYYRARYYSPRLGRFLQVDAIGYNNCMNLYTYVDNNPLNLKDPLGLAGMTGLFWPAASPMNPLNHGDAWESLAVDWEATKINLLDDTIVAIDAYEAALPVVQGVGVLAGGLATLGTGAAIGSAATVTTPQAFAAVGLFYGGTVTATIGGTKIIAASLGRRDYVDTMPNSFPGMVGMGFGGNEGAVIGDLVNTALTADFSGALPATHTVLSMTSGAMNLCNEPEDSPK
ncbi:MAG: RHS repeat-associated core domain-containing protein [Planctomycetota bacterium]